MVNNSLISNDGEVLAWGEERQRQRDRETVRDRERKRERR